MLLLCNALSLARLGAQLPGKGGAPTLALRSTSGARRGCEVRSGAERGTRWTGALDADDSDDATEVGPCGAGDADGAAAGGSAALRRRRSPARTRREGGRRSRERRAGGTELWEATRRAVAAAVSASRAKDKERRSMGMFVGSAVRAVAAGAERRHCGCGVFRSLAGEARHAAAAADAAASAGEGVSVRVGERRRRS